MSIINKRKSKCKVQCGDCTHFNKVKKEGYESICKKMGVIATNRAPDCFSPDLTVFRKLSALPSIESLGEIVKDFSPKQNRILSMFFMEQSKIKETEFYFGQPVFINLGEDYLSHYYKAFVVGTTSLEIEDQKVSYLQIVSRLKKSKTVTSLLVPCESVLNQEQFNKKALELYKSAKIVRDKVEYEHFRNLPISDKLDSKGRIDVSKLIRLDLDVDVPTIDKAPKEETTKKKKVKDLTEIFSEIRGEVKITKLKTKKKVKIK